MAQGFTKGNITLPLPIAQGGNGVTAIPNMSSYDNTGTVLATNAYTKITYDTKNWDIGTYYSTTNKRYTPLIAGTYFVSASTLLTSSVTATVYALAVYKNGSIYKRSSVQTTATTADTSLSVSCLVQLNGSTDYIEIFAFNGSAITTKTTTTGASDTFFDAVWIGPSA